MIDQKKLINNDGNPSANSTIIEILDDTVVNNDSNSTHSSTETLNETFNDAESEDVTVDDPNGVPSFTANINLNDLPARMDTRKQFRTFDLNNGNVHFAFITKWVFKTKANHLGKIERY